MLARKQRCHTADIVAALQAVATDIFHFSPLRDCSHRLNIVLFGSWLDESVSSPGDIDVWLDGEAADVNVAFTELRHLGGLRGLPFDVVAPARLAPCIRRACQWNAAQGLAVVGQLPQLPDAIDSPMAAVHQDAYQARAAAEARAVISRAEILAVVGAPEASAFVELAARLFLRSRAGTPAEWRGIRRLSVTDLVSQLADYGCTIAKPVQWEDPLLIEALRMLITSGGAEIDATGSRSRVAVRDACALRERSR